MNSNMYPSAQYQYFGIFVQAVAEGLRKHFRIKVNGRQKTCNRVGGSIEYLRWFVKGILLSSFAEYDLLYIHFVSRSSFPFVQIAALRGKRIVLNFHGSDAYDRGPWRQFARGACRHADSVVFPSAAFRDEVAGLFGVPSNRCFVSPSGGIDTNSFRPHCFEGTFKAPVHLGFVSSLTREKGIYLLIDALKTIPRDLWHLTVVGTGSQELEVRRAIIAEGLSEKVCCMGALPHDRLPDKLRDFDFLVFPTMRESLGLVGLEALSCGVPVIGSDILVMKSYLADGYNGLLFRSGDSRSLAKTIEAGLTTDPALYRSMALSARDTARKYDRHHTIRQLAKMLELLVLRDRGVT